MAAPHGNLSNIASTFIQPKLKFIEEAKWIWLVQKLLFKIDDKNYITIIKWNMEDVKLKYNSGTKLLQKNGIIVTI